MRFSAFDPLRPVQGSQGSSGVMQGMTRVLRVVLPSSSKLLDDTPSVPELKRFVAMAAQHHLDVMDALVAETDTNKLEVMVADMLKVDSELVKETKRLERDLNPSFMLKPSSMLSRMLRMDYVWNKVRQPKFRWSRLFKAHKRNLKDVSLSLPPLPMSNPRNLVQITFDDTDPWTQTIQEEVYGDATDTVEKLSKEDLVRRLELVFQHVQQPC